MRFYTRKRRTPSVIIVSLIDILAILLIFFIVSTTFRKGQPSLKINLPEAKTAEESSETAKNPVILQVKAANELSLDGKPVSMDSLGSSLLEIRQASPDRPIALQADREAPFGIVVKVLDALKQSGVQNIPAFTQPEPSTQ